MSTVTVSIVYLYFIILLNQSATNSNILLYCIFVMPSQRNEATIYKTYCRSISSRISNKVFSFGVFQQIWAETSSLVHLIETQLLRNKYHSAILLGRLETMRNEGWEWNVCIQLNPLENAHQPCLDGKTSYIPQYHNTTIFNIRLIHKEINDKMTNICSLTAIRTTIVSSDQKLLMPHNNRHKTSHSRYFLCLF